MVSMILFQHFSCLVFMASNILFSGLLFNVADNNVSARLRILAAFKSLPFRRNISACPIKHRMFFVAVGYSQFFIHGSLLVIFNQPAYDFIFYF